MCVTELFPEIIFFNLWISTKAMQLTAKFISKFLKSASMKIIFILGCCAAIRPGDGGINHLWNVSQFLRDYTETFKNIFTFKLQKPLDIWIY
jgi:hypothetical protein